MPDYRSVIAGTKLALGEALDVLLISPEPDNVEQTFVAAQTSRDDMAIRASLVGDPRQPRVTWEEVAGGIVGHRATEVGDAGADAGAGGNGDAGAAAVTASRAPELPRWLVHLSEIADDAKDGPILVLGFSELERETIAIPSLPTLPAPSRGFLSLTITADGFIAAGWLAFGDAATAKTF